MEFEVVPSVNDCKNKDTIYLILDSWDDWFTYSTLFKVRYIDQNGIKHKMSGVKIGQRRQGRSPNLPEKFSTLSDDFFSLGAFCNPKNEEGQENGENKFKYHHED